MKKLYDIYFGDLVPETQREILKFVKLEKPRDGNFNLFPLTTIYPKDIREFNEEVKKDNVNQKPAKNCGSTY